MAMSGMQSELQKSGSNIFQNVTGILKERFPGVRIEDIPGFDGNAIQNKVPKSFDEFFDHDCKN